MTDTSDTAIEAILPALIARDMAHEAAMLLALQAERKAGWVALTLYEDALTEAEAIFGGEYGDHYGPMCEMAFAARDARTLAAITPNTEAKP